MQSQLRCTCFLDLNVKHIKKWPWNVLSFFVKLKIISTILNEYLHQLSIYKGLKMKNRGKLPSANSTLSKMATFFAVYFPLFPCPTVLSVSLGDYSFFPVLQLYSWNVIGQLKFDEKQNTESSQLECSPVIDAFIARVSSLREQKDCRRISMFSR